MLDFSGIKRPVCVPTWGKTVNFADFKNTSKCQVTQLITRGTLLDTMLSAEFEAWAKSAATYFAKTMGLEGSFALDAARLYIALWGAGLNPRISRGWSDPAHQKALQEAWDRGERAGLRVRPASNSQHTLTTFFGSPASKAIDMPSSNDAAAAKIAANLGIGAGATFTTPDPGHYFKR